MYSSVNTLALFGTDSKLIAAEADIAEGMPVFEIVGFLGSEVREARERVRTALRNSGYLIPPKRITVNLSPADLRKSGTSFDLAVAVSLLSAMGFAEPVSYEDTVIIGELGLSGEVKGISGILPMVMDAKKYGFRRCIIPDENISEGSSVEGIDVIGVHTLQETAGYLGGAVDISPAVNTAFYEELDGNRTYSADFADVTGQETVKRAMEIAAAGMHNILLIGPPGSGKTMMAKRLPTILPSLTAQECFEITKIYSVAGHLEKGMGMMTERPFVSPHHTISSQALVGGGRIPRPGACSMAHRGVLFLDELPEFNRGALEILRQPMEEKEVYISRVNGNYVFPADFLLAGALNPCRCGYYPDRSRCNCSITDIRAYLSKISGPLLDRIDICTEVSAVKYADLNGMAERKAESSSEIRKRVMQAFEIQKERYKGTDIRFNSDIDPKQIELYCSLESAEQKLMEKTYKSLSLSARAYHRILRVARTIADLSGTEKISVRHLAEAIGYRSIEGRYWNG